MFSTLGSFDRSYAAVRGAVPRARHDLKGFGAAHGLAPDRLDAISVAISEAVANAVVHAYRGTRGEVHVAAAATGDELWVLVEDDGCGFQSLPAHPGLGWGFALIADVTDEFVLSERTDGGTQVRMHFRLESEPDGTADEYF